MVINNNYNKKKRVGILTSGGNSQGMNSLIFYFIKMSINNNIEIFLIKDGFLGLINNLIEKFTINDYNKIFLNKIIKSGGTILGSSRTEKFKNNFFLNKSINNLKKNNIDYLIVIGGNGSYVGAKKLNELGIKCFFIPGTIDNDICFSEYSIGFDSSINIVTNYIDNINDTVISHNFCAIIEVMGRHCGNIALYSGIASGADIISIPEYPLSIKKILKKIKNIIFFNKNKKGIIIVISELIYDNNEIKKLIENIENIYKYNVKYITLGHIQRGGFPSALERFRSFQIIEKIIFHINKNQSGIAISFNNGRINSFLMKDNKYFDFNKNIIKIWKKFDKLNSF